MNNVNSRFLEEARELEKRWARSGLLEGITDRYSRSVTAVLLEGQRLLNEQPQGDDIAQFKRIAIPLIRRVYPMLGGASVSGRAEVQKYRWQEEGF